MDVLQKKGDAPQGSAKGAPPTARTCRGRVNHTKFSILITLLAILRKGKIHYCEPYPNTILKLLATHHLIEIERRWLFQCMRDLQDSGYLYRKIRRRRNENGELRSLSSLCWLTMKGAKFLASRMVSGAREIVNAMIDWIHKDDKRPPRNQDFMPTDTPLSREKSLVKLKELLAGIG